MKISFTVEYDLDYDPEGQFFGSFTVREEKNCVLKHSGSSYLRIIADGKQIGTISGIGEFPNDFIYLTVAIPKEKNDV